MTVEYSDSRTHDKNHNKIYPVNKYLQCTAGVETLIDDCRRIYLDKSNQWDAVKDVLMVGQRLGVLSEVQRTAGPYKYVIVKECSGL